ncbi:HTH-type transcriptional regulator MalT [compost metagenome]
MSRKKGKAASQSPVQLRDTEAFASFFESEVLSRLSGEDVELLLHMAVCNRFCASLCAALSGRPEHDAVTLLARLESDNLFLIPIDSADPENWYRLHPLLRENLLKHFESRSEEEQRSVHARAWVWFREHAHLDEAVRHAVAGGEAEAATRLVERRMEALYAQGDLRVLVELIRQLPAEQVRQHIGLRIVQARMHIYAREFAACIECVEQLDRDIPHDHREDRFRLALVRALLAIQRDDTDGALAVLPELMDPPKGADAASVGGAINLRSWLSMHNGDYEEARRIQLERPVLTINGAPLLGTPGGTLQGRCLVGLSYAMQGRMNQAERVYREVLHEAERGGKTCAESMYMAIALLGEVLYEMNDVEAAHKLLAERIDTLERISIPDSVLRVIEVLWKAEWRIGNRLESSAYMERLEEYATKLGLDRLLAYSLTWQFLWSLLQGERADAEAKLERLNDLDARHPHAEGSALKEIYLLAETCRVRWQASQGDLKGAARRLERLIERSEGTGRQLGTARLLMLGAVFDKQLGQLDAARAKVIEVLRWGHRLGLLRSLLDIHPAAANLIEEVTRSETLDPVLAFYVERLLATQQPVPAAAQAPAPADPRARKPLAASVEPLKERELEILHLLAQALPNKKIARTLGLSPETVKWHLSHIYSKLGVSSRDEAVARMRDMETGLEE